MPERGFTTSITIYLPIGMKSKHLWITSHMLLIIYVTNSIKKQNKYFCYLFLTSNYFIEKWENTDLDHFNSKPFICTSTVQGGPELTRALWRHKKHFVKCPVHRDIQHWYEGAVLNEVIWHSCMMTPRSFQGHDMYESYANRILRTCVAAEDSHYCELHQRRVNLSKRPNQTILDHNVTTTQQTQDVESMLVYRWSNVVDGVMMTQT